MTVEETEQEYRLHAYGGKPTDYITIKRRPLSDIQKKYVQVVKDHEKISWR